MELARFEHCIGGLLHQSFRKAHNLVSSGGRFCYRVYLLSVLTVKHTTAIRPVGSLNPQNYQYSKQVRFETLHLQSDGYIDLLNLNAS